MEIKDCFVEVKDCHSIKISDNSHRIIFNNKYIVNTRNTTLDMNELVVCIVKNILKEEKYKLFFDENILYYRSKKDNEVHTICDKFLVLTH